MTNSLEQRIAARVARTAGAQRSARRVAFLAQQDEIAQALAAGWTVKDIWRTLSEEGRITVCYQSFCEYVNRWIRNTAKPARHRHAATSEVAAQPNETPRRPTPSGFTINPQPKKEDLI